MASAAGWQEVQQAAEENRHELVLTGPSVSERIEKSGLDDGIYNLVALNFLEISKTCLKEVSHEIGKLVNLTSLVLNRNQLETVPKTIGQLTKLKLLDLSNNKIDRLPDEIGEMKELETLNLSCNELDDCSDVSYLNRIHILDLSHNELECLPDGLTGGKLIHLYHLNASDNKITSLPAELSELPQLKILNVANNKIDTIPAEYSECTKLKEFDFSGNKLKDRRLGKMMGQCSTKAVLDYLRNILQKQQEAEGKGKKGKGKGKKKAKGGADNDIEELNQNIMEVLRFDEDNGILVEVYPGVADVRPYIVCCIVRKLNFQKSLNMFKRFITFQTKLHDGVCAKRQAATIATHDLKAVKSPLKFQSQVPTAMKLVPLFKTKEATADKLVSQLWAEAEQQRKEKKRNTVSGIHKYLDLVMGKPEYPCLIDKDGVVISFPPITNCEPTKVSKETTDLFIEVTSTLNLDTCKKVMDELLVGLLEMGVGETQEGAVAAGGGDDHGPLKQDQQLTLEQVKITDHEGNLKVIYPSRTDLTTGTFKVIRTWE